MNNRLDDAVREALEARRGDWPQIALRCRVSHSWLSKFVRGQIKNPGYATLIRLRTELIGTEGAPSIPEPEELSNAN